MVTFPPTKLSLPNTKLLPTRFTSPFIIALFFTFKLAVEFVSSWLFSSDDFDDKNPVFVFELLSLFS